MFRQGSPFPGEFPENDLDFEKLFSDAMRAPSLDIRVESVRSLSEYFLENNYAVPLFEMASTYWINPEKIESLGEQYGGLTLYINRLNLKKRSL